MTILLVLQIWTNSEPLWNVGRSHRGTGHGQTLLAVHSTAVKSVALAYIMIR